MTRPWLFYRFLNPGNGWSLIWFYPYICLHWDRHYGLILFAAGRTIIGPRS